MVVNPDIKAGSCIGFDHDKGEIFLFPEGEHLHRIPFPNGKMKLMTHIRRDVMFHSLASSMAAMSGYNVGPKVERVEGATIWYVRLIAPAGQ